MSALSTLNFFPPKLKYKMRYPKSILIMLLIILTYSCKPEESVVEVPESTWISVYARYLAPDQAYKTEVTFFKGDSALTALPSKIEGTVIIGDQTMQSRQLSDNMIRYQADFNGDFRKELSLEIEAKNIDRKQLPIRFKKTPEVQVAQQKISLSQGGEIIFPTSVQLDDFEEIIIMLNDSKKQTASISIKGPSSLEKIAISSEMIASLKNIGTGNFYLLRKRSVKTDDKNEFWDSLIEYYSDEIEVEIVK